MATLTVEEARTRVILANPGMDSAAVRKEADRLIAELDHLTFMDNARAQFDAQAAEDSRQQAIAAQRRSEAVADAAGIVRASHPGWDKDSIERESQRLVSENESALAKLAVKEALTEI